MNNQLNHRLPRDKTLFYVHSTRGSESVLEPTANNETSHGRNRFSRIKQAKKAYSAGATLQNRTSKASLYIGSDATVYNSRVRNLLLPRLPRRGRWGLPLPRADGGTLRAQNTQASVKGAGANGSEWYAGRVAEGGKEYVPCWGRGARRCRSRLGRGKRRRRGIPPPPSTGSPEQLPRPVGNLGVGFEPEQRRGVASWGWESFSLHFSRLPSIFRWRAYFGMMGRWGRRACDFRTSIGSLGPSNGGLCKITVC